MDAQTIVNAVNRRRYPRNYWGRIARHCGDFLIQNPRSSIRWTRRSGNGAANILANWASYEPNKEWANEIPHCIWACIQKDKALCNLSWYIILSFFNNKKISNKKNRNKDGWYSGTVPEYTNIDGQIHKSQDRFETPHTKSS
jgi:hypothetical protein